MAQRSELSGRPLGDIPQNFGGFSELLRRGGRVTPTLPGKQIPVLTAQEFAEGMRREGYALEDAEYGEIEAGRKIPKEPVAYVETAAKVYGVPKRSIEAANLALRLAIDLLIKDVGPENDVFSQKVAPETLSSVFDVLRESVQTRINGRRDRSSLN